MFKRHPAASAPTRKGWLASREKPGRWAILMGGLLLISAVLALVIPSGYGLTCFADVMSFTLWAAAVVTMLRAGLASSGRIRVFWMAFAGSAALAGTNLGAWAYLDIIARHGYPQPFWADIPLFLQPVPMMAAVAVQPHRRRGSPNFYLGTLNFLILLLWWVYLYSFRIFPHEYIVYSSAEFNRYYNTLYVCEFLILVAAFGWLWMSTAGRWRQFYFHLFLASVLYVLAFQWLNADLLRGVYHPGDLHDVVDNAATCWFVWIAITFANLNEEQQDDMPISLRLMAVWSSLAALAVLSVPLMGIWTVFQTKQPPALRDFRLMVTLVASGVLAFCVFLRQRVMDYRLVGLLATSRETLDNLQRVQTELVRTEQLGSLGQLVTGAAHEINNPLTAILGYSELLTGSDELSPQQASVASIIGQEARRARDLVSDLANFARRHPTEKSLVDIGTLLQRAIEMENANPGRSGVQIVAKLPETVLRVCGNTNALFQGCVQLVGGIADQLQQRGGGTLLLRASVTAEDVLVEFSCLQPNGAPFPADMAPCGVAADRYASLRFSSVHNIVEDNGGQLSVSEGNYLLLRLPVAQARATAAATT